MDKPAVLILSEDASEYLPLLSELVDHGVSLSVAHNADEALSKWSGQAVMLGQPDLAAEVLEQMPQVRWLQSTWAGITPLLRHERPGLCLTGVKGVFGSQISEYVFACLLAWETRLFKRLEWQREKRWNNAPSGQLRSKTLCIMGTGSIGGHIALKARAFDMRVLGFSRSGLQKNGFERVYNLSALEDFLKQADYLVSVLPDTPQTRHLLNAAAFRAMKNTACLVNAGRGNVVDEAALVRALEAGELSGAALDVFQQEPLPADNALWTARNCLVTGHVASRSWPADIAKIFVRNYRKYQQGQPLDNLIDMDRGY